MKKIFLAATILITTISCIDAAGRQAQQRAAATQAAAAALPAARAEVAAAGASCSTAHQVIVGGAGSCDDLMSKIHTEIGDPLDNTTAAKLAPGGGATADQRKPIKTKLQALRAHLVDQVVDSVLEVIGRINFNGGRGLDFGYAGLPGVNDDIAGAGDVAALNMFLRHTYQSLVEHRGVGARTPDAENLVADTCRRTARDVALTMFVLQTMKAPDLGVTDAPENYVGTDFNEITGGAPAAGGQLNRVNLKAALLRNTWLMDAGAIASINAWAEGLPPAQLLGDRAAPPAGGAGRNTRTLNPGRWHGEALDFAPAFAAVAMTDGAGSDYTLPALDVERLKKTLRRIIVVK